MATESTPIRPDVEGAPIGLVLTPHARAGKQLGCVTHQPNTLSEACPPLTRSLAPGSIIVALLFMYGFNTALIFTAYLNWGVPCDQPYNGFLLAAGLLGLVRAPPNLQDCAATAHQLPFSGSRSRIAPCRRRV